MQKGDTVMYVGAWDDRYGEGAVVLHDSDEHDTVCQIAFADGVKLITTPECIIDVIVEATT